MVSDLEPSSQLELVYVADALCSWCWGFAPVVERLRTEVAPDLPFRLVMGGLRPGPYAQPIDDAMLRYLRRHWESVAERTGQPFNFSFFDSHGERYDTEPAARGVVTMRQIAPALELPFFHRVQRAFYQDHVDCTLPSQVIGLANVFDVDPAAWRTTYNHPDTLQRTREDYVEARRMGIDSFPALALRRGGIVSLITAGYQEFDSLCARLKQTLAELGDPPQNRPASAS